MMRIYIYENDETPEIRIAAVGHANAGRKGQDLVCAAVSTVMQVAELGLKKIAEDHPEHIEVITTCHASHPQEAQLP